MIKNSYELKVRGYELDSFGHVNNAVYMQYAEAALWNFFKSTGMLDNMQKEELSPVILESTQRYIHELKMLDEVRIDSELTCSCGIVRYKHSIINKATGLVSCKIKGKLAYVNKERIICNIPECIRTFIEGEKNDNSK